MRATRGAPGPEPGVRSLVLVALMAGSCLLGLSGCEALEEKSQTVSGGASKVIAADASVASLPATPEWAYMLEGDVAAEIVGTTFDVLVMDYTKDGTENVAQLYTAAEMVRMKSYGATRTLLAYLSIGEAEGYRYYFDPSWADDAAPGFRDPDAPGWLGALNPDWPGDYKVRYWDGEWQEIVLAYVERLIARGYDGVYLDIVDGFEYWSDPENGEGYTLGEADAAERMIAFVSRIATRARGLRGDFLVIPQNGERLLGFDTNGRYLDSINGLAVEDLFYDERTPLDESVTAERMIYLDKVLAAGKPVLVVDYTYAGAGDSLVEDFRARAAAAGYCAYAARTDRQLDSLVKFGGQGE